MNVRHSQFSPQFRAHKTVLAKLGLLLGTIVALSASRPAQAQTWTGPTFREFSGTNHTGANSNKSLYNNALSWDRRDVVWATLEPTQGNWDQSKLVAWGQHLLNMRAVGAEVLPVLVYTAPWAADKSARTWIEENSKWEATPRADGNMDIKKSLLQSDGSWLLTSTTIASDYSKFPAANAAHWKNYVTKVVTFLRQAPYNVKYFQVWNEAHPRSGFFQGNLDEYMQKVHLPAATIVHSLGGKVVYGGWPAVTNVNPMVAMLDRNNAWGSIDVLDLHYQQGTQLQTLRNASNNRGYSGLPIWETELGYSGNKVFIPNQYPRLLHFALSNNWNVANKYQMMYYAHEVPNDPDNPEYGRNLWTGTSLSHHGQTLQTLANQLDGGKLGLLSGVTSTPALTPQQDTTLGSLEAITVSNRIVVAAHITPTVYGNTTNLVVKVPISRSQITKAERVDITGVRQDITSTLVVSGTSTNVTAVIKDGTGTTARSWNDDTTGCKVFYVVITKSTSAAASNSASTSGIAN